MAAFDQELNFDTLPRELQDFQLQELYSRGQFGAVRQLPQIHML
jgi:hypothetical protein